MHLHYYAALEAVERKVLYLIQMVTAAAELVAWREEKGYLPDEGVWPEDEEWAASA